jgi:hypothetical protein
MWANTTGCIPWRLTQLCPSYNPDIGFTYLRLLLLVKIRWVILTRLHTGGRGFSAYLMLCCPTLCVQKTLVLNMYSYHIKSQHWEFITSLDESLFSRFAQRVLILHSLHDTSKSRTINIWSYTNNAVSSISSRCRNCYYSLLEGLNI